MKRAIFLFIAFMGSLCAAPLEERLESAIPVKSENLIGYLLIDKDRPIDQSTYLYVKFALEHFKEKKVSFVLLQLNTPGGEVFSTMKICDLLQKLDTNDHIPVIAFIDNWAISAGAMLAYSSRFIGTVKSASMGAAEPVSVGAEGKMESAGEKINSALRAEISNLANFYGRNPLIAEAMVDKDLILVLRKGKIVRLEEESAMHRGDIPVSRKGKLLTLNAEQMIEYGVADFLVPPSPMQPITAEEEKEGRISFSKNLLSTEPFFAKIPDAYLLPYSDWKIDFFSLLSHPFIASLLVIGLIAGIYVEVSNPGMIFPAGLALFCLSLLLLSNFALSTINWLEVIILVSGVALLLLEILLLPSFGVIAAIGVILTLLGSFLLFQPDFGPQDFSFEWQGMAHGLMKRLGWFSGALLVAIALIAFVLRFLPHRFPLLKRMILRGEQEASEGFVAGLPNHLLPKIGSRGVVHTSLRPGGKIAIGKEIFEAFSDGMWIEKGEGIVVISHVGNKIIVHKEIP